MIKLRCVIEHITSRAKKICVFVGTTKALAYAIKQNTVSKRNTKLKEDTVSLSVSDAGH